MEAGPKAASYLVTYSVSAAFVLVCHSSTPNHKIWPLRQIGMILEVVLLHYTSTSSAIYLGKGVQRVPEAIVNVTMHVSDQVSLWLAEGTHRGRGKPWRLYCQVSTGLWIYVFPLVGAGPIAALLLNKSYSLPITWGVCVRSKGEKVSLPLPLSWVYKKHKRVLMKGLLCLKMLRDKCQLRVYGTR